MARAQTQDGVRIGESMQTTLSHRSTHCGRHGFSLMELLVVLTVAMLLTGILLPAMSALRENVNRVMCASNQRQIAVGLIMFAHDYEKLPPSQKLDGDEWEPPELMASHHGLGYSQWDGIGLLFQKGYCAAPECYYCPSHSGEHPFERYEAQWRRPGVRPIYMNYHYAGDHDWVTRRPRFINNLESMVITSDGLRTIDDFNHKTGMNVAYGDGSVQWRADIVSILPLLPNGTGQYNVEEYNTIWQEIEQNNIAP